MQNSTRSYERKYMMAVVNLKTTGDNVLLQFKIQIRLNLK